MHPPYLLPWNIPTPLTASEGYVSIPGGHERFALETSANGAFDVPTRREEEVLWSDLQDPLFGSWKHSGSGRSGFFADKYLKGVGRTALATNWARGEDAYHASGHLFASGGIREYLVSVYLESVGLGSEIVPCEAVLLRPLPKALKQALAAHYGSSLLPIDLSLQAVSVKPGGFARMSNLVWFVNRLRMHTDDASACAYFMEEHALPFGHGLAEDRERTPETIADALAGAVDRTLRSFERFFSAGVYWGSVANNFTLDGRFLDLELPTIVGRPYFGGVACTQRTTSGPSSMGLALNTGDFIEAVGYLRRGIQRLQHGLRLHLLEAGSSPNHLLVRDLSQAITQRFEGHALFDDHAMLQRLAALFDYMPEKPGKLRSILEGEYNSWLKSIPYDLPEGDFARAPVTMARPESMVECQLMVHGPDTRSDWDVCIEVNTLLREIDQTPEPDEAAAKVSDAAKRLRALARR